MEHETKLDQILAKFDHLESIIIELQHASEAQKKSYDQLIELERDTIVTTSNAFVGDDSTTEGYEGEPYPLKLPFICNFCTIL
jgi:hypothetical protein